MRKLIIAALSAMLVAGFISGAQAKVSGNCSNCHTMHNSQNGQLTNSSGPQEFLIKAGGGTRTICWGCHGQGTTSNVDTYGAPQVMHTNATDLAGGNYAYVTGAKSLGTGASFSTAGHNVKDTGVTDTLTTPPGDQHATGINNTNANTTLTCSGVYGCHGDRSVSGVGLSIKGAHHYADTALKFGTINTANQALSSGSTGTKVGSSFRFLMGVKGAEVSNWQNSSSANHNEYFGAISKGTESTATVAGANTISGLCGECHGKFHGPAVNDIAGATGSSPWLRHPTDVILPNTAGSEYLGYTTYNVTAPVARQSITNNLAAPVSTVTPGTDVVMCLSCHTAHASKNYKMMRWDYKSNPATGGSLATALSGCNVCHTSKN